MELEITDFIVVSGIEAQSSFDFISGYGAAVQSMFIVLYLYGAMFRMFLLINLSTVLYLSLIHFTSKNITKNQIRDICI